MYCHYQTTSYVSCSWFFNLYAHYAAQYPSTFRVASTEAVSYDLSRGVPTGIFDYARFIFVQYVRIVLQCKPDVKLSYVILCWINPCLSLSLSDHLRQLSIQGCMRSKADMSSNFEITMQIHGWMTLKT